MLRRVEKFHLKMSRDPRPIPKTEWYWVQSSAPPGTDPLKGQRQREREADLEEARTSQPMADAPAKSPRDRGKIFNEALLKAVGHKDVPREVKEALTTEDGDELQLVGDEMPPDPNQEPIE